MMIFIGADYQELGLTSEQMQERMGKWFSWNQKMREDGVVLHGDALVPHVRRVSGAERTVTDVAATEIKELIGGYYTVKAEDMDAVVEIAQGYPDYDLGGTVEIREIMVFEQ